MIGAWLIHRCWLASERLAGLTGSKLVQITDIFPGKCQII